VRVVVYGHPHAARAERDRDRAAYAVARPRYQRPSRVKIHGRPTLTRRAR
jgi:hypothetical protein